MGSTAKIIFGSFLAISVALMFLIFSMQKSAQLALDVQTVQDTVHEKDKQIASISSELESAQAITQSAQAKNKIIPQLKSSLKTTEQEKLVYIQQLDDFQSALQSQKDVAKQRLTETATLQKQLEDHQQLIVEGEELLAQGQDQIDSSKQQNTKLADALVVSQLEIEKRGEELGQFADTVEQKDRVIQIYKEKLDQSAEEMILLLSEDTNEQLNLKLILDELAAKSEAVVALNEQLKNSIPQGADDAAPETSPDPTSEKDQALIKKLSIENDALGTGLKEQKNLIDELRSKLAADEELVASLAAEAEQLQLTGKADADAIRVLQHQATGNEQELNQLQASLSSKEEELVQAREQSLAIAEPLKEKITGLELELTQAATLRTDLSKQLSETESSLTALQNEKQLIADQLHSSQVSLETAALQMAELGTVIDTSKTALMEEETSRQSLAGEIDSIKLVLADSNEKVAFLNNSNAELEQKLVNTNDAQSQLTADLVQNQTSLAEKDAALQEIRSQMDASSVRLAELQKDLDHSGAREVEASAFGREQEARIARLIDEVAAAKAAVGSQSEIVANLQARNEELLAALSAKQEVAPVVEEVIEEVQTETPTSEVDAAAPTEEATETKETEDAQPEEGVTVEDTGILPGEEVSSFNDAETTGTEEEAATTAEPEASASEENM